MFRTYKMTPLVAMIEFGGKGETQLREKETNTRRSSRGSSRISLIQLEGCFCFQSHRLSNRPSHLLIRDDSHQNSLVFVIPKFSCGSDNLKVAANFRSVWAVFQRIWGLCWR